MKNLFNSKTVKSGLSAVGITAILIAILLAINFLAALLPKSSSLLDLSNNSMYSIGDTSKRDISKVNESVTVYLLSAGGESTLNDTGVHLDNFLKRACALNKNVKYSVIDLYADSAFLSDRSIDSSTVTINSVVVESSKRHRYIDSGDIFYYHVEGLGKLTQSQAQLAQMYYNLVPTYQFAGESKLIEALTYVTSDSLPMVISLTGHGETAIPESLKTQFIDNGFAYSELATLALVPGCEMLLMNSPTSDISENEAALISEYLNKGGNLMLTTMPETSVFTNLCSVLDKFGLGFNDGIIIEQTQGNYTNYPYYLYPTQNAHTALDRFSGVVFLPFAHGIGVSEKSGITTTEVLTTSERSYIISTSQTTLEKPEGQEEQSHAVGVISENTSNGSAVIWFSCQALLDETANGQVNGGNFNYATAIASALCDSDNASGESSTAPLVLKSEQLTISSTVLAILSIVLVIALPLAILIIGGVYCHKRKIR